MSGLTRTIAAFEKKLKGTRALVVERGSEEEAHLTKLIKCRFDKRNKFFGLFHDLIRMIMLYRSLKYP